MRHALRAVSEALLWSFIVVTAIVNLAVYTHVVRGADPVGLSEPPAEPSPEAALATPTPRGPANCPSREPLPAELDRASALAGTFVASQGCLHTGAYPLRTSVPFCDEGDVNDGCYASNPPSSGLHLPVQGEVRLPGDTRMKVPPDPGVYESAVPREAIPHIQEHGGVYAGYNCASDECRQAAASLAEVVRQELSLDARVVLSPDPDLEPDTIGLAALTRIDVFAASAYNDERARRFIKDHSCRFDPERFCAQRPLN